MRGWTFFEMWKDDLRTGQMGIFEYTGLAEAYVSADRAFSVVQSSTESGRRFFLVSLLYTIEIFNATFWVGRYGANTLSAMNHASAHSVPSMMAISTYMRMATWGITALQT
jgi:hypothetical protein